MSIIVNIYFTGRNGSARRFAEGVNHLSTK